MYGRIMTDHVKKLVNPFSLKKVDLVCIDQMFAQSLSRMSKEKEENVCSINGLSESKLQIQ